MSGNILIVDDDPDALKLLKDTLAGDGHIVRLFNNGELALRSIAVEAPELILLDVRMPGMTGFEVCRRIKKDERWKDISVIFISAASDIEDKVKAFQEGGVDYITKPFQKEEVIARVRTHIALMHAIQRKKKIAEALQMSEASLRMAQALAHVGHWEWDRQSGLFVCSEEMYRILGLEPRGQIKNHEAFLQAVHPDDRERVANHMSGVLAGNCLDIEYRIILPTGEVRALHGNGKVFRHSAHNNIKINALNSNINTYKKEIIINVTQDITVLKETQSKLEKQANTDFLTNCDNRRQFLANAEQELLRIRRYGGDLSILMLDLDHFKNINDRYGHQIGDRVLKEFVRICQSLLRKVDVIGRMGGEEFAIMLPETGGQRALEVAGRLCQIVAAKEMPVENMPPVHFTTSIGVAALAVDDRDVDAILNRADDALYKAKHAGRNRASA
jgi:diguanylate cyclase (GGDEF)-like protein